MDTNENISPVATVHIPLALLALAISFLFILQIKGSNQAAENMKWQSTNASKQITDLKAAEDKNRKTIEDRRTMVAQSEQTQKQFTDLMKELNDLSVAGDKDAQLIITKYGIKVADNPAGGTPAPEKN
jgi:hypothetical protein